MESSSLEATVSAVESVTNDLKNQSLGSSGDGKTDNNDASKGKLKLEDLNWDHSFVRELPGDPRADTIPRQVLSRVFFF